MNYYKFHIGDYLTRTMHLDDAEDLAYRRLLDLYYITEKPIPNDLEAIEKRIRLEVDVFKPVLEEFFELVDNQWFNQRCADEIKKYQKFVKHNQKIAKKSAAARVNKPAKNRISKGLEEDEPAVKPAVEPAVNHPYNQEPITNKKQKTSSTASTRFEEFWTVWPASKRKVAKATCQKRWLEKKLDDRADEILAHVRAMKQTEQWREGFEPAPLTYLNQSRFLDDLPVGNVAGDSLKDGVFAGRRVL